MRKLCLVLIGSLMFFSGNLWSQTLPAGFSTTTVGSGWNLPMGTAFTNDGQKLFVWEKDGRVYVCNRNAAGAYVKQTTPVLDIVGEVGNWGDYGLLGFALDPNFNSNGLIYLLYVVDRHYLNFFGTGSYNPNTTESGATIGRVTRYKTITSGSNLVADPATRFVLLGETKSTGFPILHDSHGVGALAFAADGTLLVTCGDGASYYLVDKGSDTDTDFQQGLAEGIIRPAENVGAFRAQMLNSHSGKLLRLDPVTGNGVSSNPYYSAAAPRSAKSRVWAFGLRNPYRFSIKPGTGSTNPAAGDIGEIYVGDVGWNTYEEVTVINAPGVNCGWPLFEGLTPQTGYTNAITANQEEPNPLFGIGGCTKQYFNFQDLIKQVTADNNKTIYNSCNPSIAIGTGNRYVHHRPVIDWRHFTNEARVGIFSGNNAATAMIGTPESNVVGTPFAGNCVTGGPFYNGSNFPAAYNNRYFMADHDANWMRCMSVDFTDVVTEVKPFGTGFSGLISITQNPLDGTLFIVELGNFSTIPTTIKQIRYGGNQAPIVKMTSDKTFGPSVLAVNFTGNTSSDPDGTIASYAWNFGDGGTSTSANPSHNFTAPANTPTKYVVKLTVTDNLGASSVDSIIISVNNTPPVVNITSPVKNSLYKIGPDTLYTCTATVTDAQHSGSALKYEWQTFLRHNSHQHPEPISNAISPTTLISRIGCNGDDYYWFIKLTVTDAAGLSTTDSAKIFPDCSPGADITPPVVSSVSPLNGTVNVAINTTASVIFNETIDPVSVTGSTFQLKDPSNNIIPASFSTSFNQVTLTPLSPLSGSTVYSVTLKGGSSGLKDLAGNAMVNDYNWSFTTVAVDNTPPSVLSILPANGSNNVATGTNVMANFNETINGSTVNSTNFQLRDAGGNLVAATITTNGSQLTLTPSTALLPLTNYTITIFGGSSGIKDLSGNALASNFVSGFTTAAVDNVAPAVVSVLPANAAIGVVTTTNVTVNMSEAIDPLTVSNATFQLKDPLNNVLTASVASSAGVLTLTPSSPLATATTYTATLVGGASGIKDMAGNALPVNYNWSFTTVGGTTALPLVIHTVTTKTGIAATSHPLTGVPAGALLVLATTADAFVSDCIVSSSPALTWTKRVDAAAVNSDNAEIWTAVYPAGGAITVSSNWGSEFSQASVLYVVLNAEPTLNGAFGTGVLQAAPSVTVTTTRENSILFGCTADWKAINGTTRTLRDAATERLYFKDGNFTTYHYTKAATTIGAYTLGVSFPSTQQASTAVLEIRTSAGSASVPPTVTTHPNSQQTCAGTVISFTSAATGGTPTVQWQSSTDGASWANISGATSATLSFTTSLSDNNKLFRAIWTNSGGPVSSNPALLTVTAVPAPIVTVLNECGTSQLTAGSFSGSLLWSNGATTATITVAVAGAYTVTQTINGCAGTPATGIASPKAIPPPPTVSVVNNCGNSVLTASGFTGSLLWSTGETTASITVTAAGTYTVAQTINGCTSVNAAAIAAPSNAAVDAPVVQVTNNCGNSVLTATGYTGTLLWSTGATTASITVAAAGTYTVTQTIGGCTSPAASGIASPLPVPSSPLITVTDDCGSSTLTASGYTGSLLWSTGETTPSITVISGGTYSVTQTVNGCVSVAGTAVATPKSVPAAPSVTVLNNCGSSTLTASGFTGSLLWSTGQTTNPVTVSSAGTYSVTQLLNGCTSEAASAVAAPLNANVNAPLLSVENNCGNSVLTASGFTGSLLWSTGATSSSITVTSSGNYSVTQTVNGCTSLPATEVAAPKSIPAAPVVLIQDNCGSSTLTASAFTGSLLWNTGESTASITVATAGTYTVTQMVDGCISGAGSIQASPKTIPAAPAISVQNNCGSSVLTASGFTGSLLWSTGETAGSITVTVGGVYNVTQIVNGCTSSAASATASPLNSAVDAPVISVINNCGSSTLTASAYTGSLLWSTGETTASITVTSSGSYTVAQTVNGCSSPQAAANASPKPIPLPPVVTVIDGCEISTLTASGVTGSLLWNTGETTVAINVLTAGTYTVIQESAGCTSLAGSATAAPKTIPPSPSIGVVNNCGHSVLTASGFSGSLLWNTGETTASITVNEPGTYTVTQTLNGCTGSPGSGNAAPLNSNVDAPGVSVENNCGYSVLTAGGFTGALLWSTGETTSSITVTTPGSYSVTQALNGCSSAATVAVAAPKAIPPPPVVSVSNECQQSVLTASGFAGSLLWSTGETANPITVGSAGTYTVTQNLNGCTSSAGLAVAAPKSLPPAPSVSVVNSCGSSALTASGFTGSLLWSTGETSATIFVTTPGNYSVSQIVDGCTSSPGNGTAAPLNSNVSAPVITVEDNCGHSILTASDFSGSLLWSTGETTTSITVTTIGTYSVSQTVNGCSSPQQSAVAAPKQIPSAPLLSVQNNCGQSLLTATAFAGTLLWSTGETTNSIIVTNSGAYSVSQTINGCTSLSTDATAAPKVIPVAPTINVVNNCGSSTLTALGYSGDLLWSTGASTASITVSAAGEYTVAQTIDGCTSASANATAQPLPGPAAPTVSVVNNCGNSVLTASGFTGSLQWSTGATTESIIVTAAGTYTVTQTVNGCTSGGGLAVANPKPIPAMPVVTVVNNCGNAVLTASAFSGALLWSNGATTTSITVATPGAYSVTQTIDGCTSAGTSVTAAPKNIPAAPTVSVVNNCGNSVLTASGYTGSLLWSTGATSASITVSSGGTYSVTQTVDGCTSTAASVVAAPLTGPPAPTVSVTNNCGDAVLTASGYTGTLLWNTGATTPSITVTSPGTYSVTQSVNGCSSLAGSGVAAPRTVPVLTSSLTGTVTTGSVFNYSPTSNISGTSFSWTRAVVAGISNSAGSGNGNISETLVNTTSSAVAVTYVYTLTANGCTNTRNLVVTVNPTQVTDCVINGLLTTSFNSTPIPAGRYIWFNSSFNPSTLGSGTAPVTISVTNSFVSFTANGQSYNLPVPDARIRFDANVTSASTQFIDNMWQTLVPRNYSNYVFMNGLSFQVPVNLPGNISNVAWTARISIDKVGIALTWRWAAAVYTSFAGHAGINVKPVSTATQNPYPNNNRAGTPENFKSFVVSGAKGAGGTNYTGNYVSSNTITCSTNPGQRPADPQGSQFEINFDDQPADAENKELEIIVMPNPSHDLFNLLIKGDNNKLATVRIVDVLGRVAEQYDKINTNAVLQVGRRLNAGSYFVEVQQGDRRKFVKIIRLN